MSKNPPMRFPWAGGRKNYGGAFSFRFGVDAAPASLANHCRYDVRLERLATEQKLTFVKAYRNAMKMMDEVPSLKESVAILYGICAGEPYIMRNLTAEQILLMMREGQMDLSVRPLNRGRAKAVAQ